MAALEKTARIASILLQLDPQLQQFDQAVAEQLANRLLRPPASVEEATQQLQLEEALCINLTGEAEDKHANSWPQGVQPLIQSARCSYSFMRFDEVLMIAEAVAYLSVAECSDLASPGPRITVTQQGLRFMTRLAKHKASQLKKVEELNEQHRQAATRQLAECMAVVHAGKELTADFVSHRPDIYAWLVAVVDWGVKCTELGGALSCQIAQAVETYGDEFKELLLGKGSAEQQRQQLKHLLERAANGRFRSCLQVTTARDWLTAPGLNRTAPKAGPPAVLAACSTAAAQFGGLYTRIADCSLADVLRQPDPASSTLPSGPWLGDAPHAEVPGDAHQEGTVQDMDIDGDNHRSKEAEQAHSSSSGSCSDDSSSSHISPSFVSVRMTTCMLGLYNRHIWCQRSRRLDCLLRWIRRLWPHCTASLVGGQVCGAAGPDTPVHFIIAGAPRCDFVPSSNHSNLLSQQSLGFDRLRELEHSLQDRRMLAEPFVYRAMGSTAPSAAASIKCGSNNPHMQVVFSIRSRAELAESVQVTRACMLLLQQSPELYAMHHLLLWSIAQARLVYQLLGFNISEETLLGFWVAHIRQQKQEQAWGLSPTSSIDTDVDSAIITGNCMLQHLLVMQHEVDGLQLTPERVESMLAGLHSFCCFLGRLVMTHAGSMLTVQQIVTGAAQAIASTSAAAAAAPAPTPAATTQRLHQYLDRLRVDSWTLGWLQQLARQIAINISATDARSPCARLGQLARSLDKCIAEAAVDADTANSISSVMRDLLYSLVTMLTAHCKTLRPQQHPQQPPDVHLFIRRDPIAGLSELALRIAQQASTASAAGRIQEASQLLFTSNLHMAEAAGLAAASGSARALVYCREQAALVLRTSYTVLRAASNSMDECTSNAVCKQYILDRLLAGHHPVEDAEQQLVTAKTNLHNARMHHRWINGANADAAHLHLLLYTAAEAAAAAAAAAGIGAAAAAGGGGGEAAGEGLDVREGVVQSLQERVELLRLSLQRCSIKQQTPADAAVLVPAAHDAAAAAAV